MSNTTNQLVFGVTLDNPNGELNGSQAPVYLHFFQGNTSAGYVLSIVAQRILTGAWEYNVTVANPPAFQSYRASFNTTPPS